MAISPSQDVQHPTNVVPSPMKPLDVSDKKKFMMSPVPKERGMLRCYVTRERTAFMKLFPKYYLFLEHANTFLMSARKRKKNRSSNYLLSLDPDDLNRVSSNYFGKVRSNFVGTEFTIYDKGESPKNMNSSNRDVRLQLGCILYVCDLNPKKDMSSGRLGFAVPLGLTIRHTSHEPMQETNILGSKGPRKLSVCVPKITSEGKYFPFPQMKDRPTMIERYKDKDWKNLYIFRNNSPQWNDGT